MESDGEFDFEPVEEVEEGSKGCSCKKEARTAKSGGDKAEIETWSDVVKGLKIEEKLETANSDKSGIESKEFDSIEMFDLDMPNRLMAKQRKR